VARLGSIHLDREPPLKGGQVGFELLGNARLRDAPEDLEEFRVRLTNAWDELRDPLAGRILQACERLERGVDLEVDPVGRLPASSNIIWQ
jgi:hypothetical protein